MPFLRIRTNQKINETAEKKLKEGLGRAISLVPGKSEEYLVLSFEPQTHMYSRGQAVPVVYLEAAIWGNESHAGYDQFTAAVAHLFHQVLGVAEENIFICYEDIPDWGVATYNFDRNRF